MSGDREEALDTSKDDEYKIKQLELQLATQFPDNKRHTMSDAEPTSIYNMEEAKGDMAQENPDSITHQGDSSEVEVDSATRHLFQDFLSKTIHKKTVNPDTRNILINNLHWRYKVDIHELGTMFKLKPRTIKQIVKQIKSCQ